MSAVLLARPLRHPRICASTRSAACQAAAPVKSSSQSLNPKAQVVSYDGLEFVVDEHPELKSTWDQRITVWSSALVSAALFAQGAAHSDSVVSMGLVILGGFIFADLGSGVYHWAVDNYGSGQTPLVGSQIAAFQGHHQRPWVITQREFCNNCSLTFKPAGTAAGMLLGVSLLGVTPAAWDVFAATAIVFIALSQQLHAWSHMKKSELPGVVVALQDAGLIISRKAHGAHHKSPFNINYCIVSGWCNPLLDCGIMYQVELFIRDRLGVSPRGWSAPSAEWRELTPLEELR